MTAGDIEIIKDVVKTFRQEIHKELEKLTDELKEFKVDIKKHIEETNGINTDVALLKKSVEVLEEAHKDLKKTNETQHIEFYGNFKQLDKFVYKLSGGIAIAGMLIVASAKLINYLR